VEYGRDLDYSTPDGVRLGPGIPTGLSVMAAMAVSVLVAALGLVAVVRHAASAITHRGGPAPGAPAAGGGAGPTEPMFGPGYRLVGADGGVFSFGNARYLGGMGGQRLSAPVIGIADTPDGGGYWEVSADGGVFTYGTAHYYGGMAGRRLSAPVIGIASTPDGQGYWLAASDGGVFSFGDARYYGTIAGNALRAPIVAIAAEPDGSGYWLASADGGVFTYGTAHYYGGMAGDAIADPIVGMAAVPDGSGYWLASADGGVFTYGSAHYYGGMGGQHLASPVVGVAGSPTGHGYWLASADGGVFTYGDAGYWGAPGGFQLNQPVTAVAAGLVPAYRQSQVEVGGRYGFDISWPQCSNRVLPPAHAFVVLGVTGGQAFTANPCLVSEWAWATSAAGAAGLYMNLNAPADLGDGRAASGPAGRCGPDNAACEAYNYGSNAVDNAVAFARRAGVSSPTWWLDVETENHWTAGTDVNALVIKGAIDELHKRHLAAGIYSTPYQWGTIAGDAGFGVPVWVAGSPDLQTAATYCSHSFNGGPVWVVQTMLDYDVNYLCRPQAASVAFGVHSLPTAPAWPLDRLPVPVNPALPVPEVATVSEAGPSSSKGAAAGHGQHKAVPRGRARGRSHSDGTTTPEDRGLSRSRGRTEGPRPPTPAPAWSSSSLS